MAHIIAPSLLAADFANLQKDIEMVNNSDAAWFHVDVMDGRFVPNISFGFPVIEAIKRHAKKPLDVHLMIAEPEKYVEQFAKAGADILTVHYEAVDHLNRLVDFIKSCGMEAGVAINPHTPVKVLEEIILDLDLVLLMSVNPGYGGQKFIEGTYSKLNKLVDLKRRLNPSVKIEVDGGVNLANAPKLIKNGAEILVAGSSVFASENPSETITALKNCDTVEV